MSLSDWHPPSPPPRTVYRGRYARLEPLSRDHIHGLREAHAEDDGTMWAYLLDGPFDDTGYSAWVDRARGLHDPMHFAVRMEDGRLGGTLSLMRINPGAGSIEVGYISFAPCIQRTRSATDAVYQTMKWAFENGYRRFEWKCHGENLRSRRAAERFGISFEGVFRQAAVAKGRNRDTAWFAAIDSEWPALETAFETWLDPANFDAEGQQRQRLADLTAPILVARDLALLSP
ncbi:MAG: GNAT family N-acetyltransferase [Boseongicola sp.]|nr:MAG: GNAT family N-acetyltransferase [Boseongicola sp.]